MSDFFGWLFLFLQKMFKKIEKISPEIIFISIITVLVVFIFLVPKIQKYNYEVLNIRKIPEKQRLFYHDFDKNGVAEEILLDNTENNYFIEYKSGNLNQRISFDNLVVRKPYFGDIDNDKIDEIIVLHQKNDSILLSALKIQSQELIFLQKEMFIDTISINPLEYYDIKTSTHNFFCDMNGDANQEFVFSILAEYSFQPRRFYYYDFRNETLRKSPVSGAYFRSDDTLDINNDGVPEIYFSTIATSNYSEKFDKINFPDTSCWFMVLNNNLNFLFQPIEFPDKNTELEVQPLLTKNGNYFAVFERKKTAVGIAKLNLYSPEGKFLKGINFDLKKYNNIASMCNSSPDFNYIYLYDQDGNIYMYDENLELKSKNNLVDSKKRENIQYFAFDINGDNKKELIYRYYNGLIIFEEGLNKILTIEKEYPEFKYLSTYYYEENRIIHFRAEKGIWYTTSISRNFLYPFRFLIYFLSFLFFYFVLLIIKKIWIKNLEQKNIKLEKIIKSKTYEIEQKNKKLEKTADFKDAVVSMLVHDLKNPLQSIISHTQNNSLPQNKFLKAESNHMLSIVLNMLETQKYENSNFVINKDRNNLYSCCKEAIEIVMPLTASKNIVIKNYISKQIALDFDFYQLKRVFQNLLANSIKFSFHNNQIIISAETKNDKVFVSVKDFGKGIETEIQNRIFDKNFYDQKQKHSFSSGLGLYFCKLAIEAHDGKIEVKSEIKKGTEITFHIPCIAENEKTEHKNSIQNKQVEFFSNFASHEIKQLQKISKNFKGIKFYNLSELYETLNKIEDKTEKIMLWKKELQKAIDNGNFEMYKKLTFENGKNPDS